MAWSPGEVCQRPSRASDGNETPWITLQNFLSITICKLLLWQINQRLVHEIQVESPNISFLGVLRVENHNVQPETTGAQGQAAKLRPAALTPIPTLTATLCCHHLKPQLGKSSTECGDSLWEVTPPKQKLLPKQYVDFLIEKPHTLSHESKNCLGHADSK